MQSLLFRIMITTTKNIYYKNTLHFLNAREYQINYYTFVGVQSNDHIFLVVTDGDIFTQTAPLVSRQGFQVMGIKLFAQITL